MEVEFGDRYAAVGTNHDLRRHETGGTKEILQLIFWKFSHFYLSIVKRLSDTICHFEVEKSDQNWEKIDTNFSKVNNPAHLFLFYAKYFKFLQNIFSPPKKVIEILSSYTRDGC